MRTILKQGVVAISPRHSPRVVLHNCTLSAEPGSLLTSAAFITPALLHGQPSSGFQVQTNPEASYGHTCCPFPVWKGAISREPESSELQHTVADYMSYILL